MVKTLRFMHVSLFTYFLSPLDTDLAKVTWFVSTESIGILSYPATPATGTLLELP